MANTQSYNYNYPKDLREQWQAYQSEYYCLTESHAVINLLVLGLQNVNLPEISFDKTETERFTIKLPVDLIQRIDETKGKVEATTRIQTIHQLIAKGLYVVALADSTLLELSDLSNKKTRNKHIDRSDKQCSLIERKTIS